MSSKLSSLLVQYGIVTVKRMEEAFQRQVIFGGSLDTILLEMNAVDEPTLYRYLYATSGIPPADLTAIDFDQAQEQTRVFPQKLAEKYLIVPVNAAEGSLQVLVTDPPDRSRLDEIGFMLGMSIISGMVPEFRLYESLERIYGVKMPLRYAGLVKRLGSPVAPNLPPDQEGGEPVTAFPKSGAAQPPAPTDESPGGQEVEALPEVAPLEGDAAGWDDPFAGAKPDTLVGMPGAEVEAEASASSNEIPPAELQPYARVATQPMAFLPLAQTVTGEIDPHAAPEPQPQAPEADERSSQTAADEIELSGQVAVATNTASEEANIAAREPEPSVKETVMGMPVFEPSDLARLEEMAVPAEEGEEILASPDPAEGEDLAEDEPILQASPEEPAPQHQPAPEPTEEIEQPFDPTPLSFDAAVEALGEARNRDDIFSLLLRGLTGYFEHVAVFTVFGDQAVGRMAIRKGVADITQIAEVSIPLTLPSIFRSTLESKGYYFGPIYDEGINFGLLAELDRPVPASAFIMPVLIRNRVVCFVFADDGLRAVDPELPDSLVFISYQISQSFQRLILNAKRDQYSAASQVESDVGKVAIEDQAPVAIKNLIAAKKKRSQSWQEAPVVSGPMTVRAPQQDGALLAQPDEMPTAAPDPSVQPAFPDLQGKRESGPMTISSAEAEPPPVPEPPPVLEPEDEPEVAASLRDSGRAITSVGYYSLTDASVQPESTEVGPPTTDSSTKVAASGELFTAGRDAPVMAAAEAESPVKVDAAGHVKAETPPKGPRTEDIWSLIDDLEKGGEMGDLAAAALQSMGDPALKLVAFRFPGRLAQERMGQHGKLPQPSSHGPLINFMVRMRDKGVPYLVELMGSENPEVRYYATFIFSELHSPQVLGPLLDRVFDSAPPVRRVATEVLKAYWQDPELRAVLEHLRAELVGPVPFRRRCAAEVLGALRDIHAVARLIELAADRDTDTAEAAQRSLLLITKQAFGDSRRRWRAWFEKNQPLHRIQWLIDALAHKESECRFLASQELHQLTGETLGYRFDQDRRDREEALRRWKQWWESKGRQRFL